MEDRGWSRATVIMDSGAAESVCPRSMAPPFCDSIFSSKPVRSILYVRANGGVILNFRTGDVTPFEKEDGVYVFEMWIPPLAE